jgi:hypothetical protein
MIRRKVSMRSQAIAAVLAGLTVMIGAECVRAAVHHDAFGMDVTGTVASSAMFGPAELDPAFQHKLLERTRGRYDRVHPLDAQAPLQGKI